MGRRSTDPLGGAVRKMIDRAEQVYRGDQSTQAWSTAVWAAPLAGLAALNDRGVGGLRGT
jgi:hypothetical protein